MIVPALMQAISGDEAKAAAVGLRALPAAAAPAPSRPADSARCLAMASNHPELLHNAVPERLPVNLMASWWRVPAASDRAN